MSKRRLQKCAYCGLVQEATTEHVIPKLLFTKPYPLDLITVKACGACHDAKNANGNEEYLRDMLTADIYGSQSSTAQQVFQAKVLSSVRRNSSELARTAVTSGKWSPFHSQGGIYLGHAFSFPLDPERVKSIFSTMVRGLYYNSQREVLPAHYNFDVLRYHPWEFKPVFEKFMSMSPNGPRVLGDVFGCAFLKAEEDRCTSYWLMWFYERVFVSVLAINPELDTDLNPPMVEVARPSFGAPNEGRRGQ